MIAGGVTRLGRGSWLSAPAACCGVRILLDVLLSIVSTTLLASSVVTAPGPGSAR